MRENERKMRKIAKEISPKLAKSDSSDYYGSRGFKGNLNNKGGK